MIYSDVNIRFYVVGQCFSRDEFLDQGLIVSRTAMSERVMKVTTSMYMMMMMRMRIGIYLDTQIILYS